MKLIKYDAACRAVAVAKTVDEVKDIRDKATAIEAYGRQAKNRGIEADGFEIRMRAERRLGQILLETDKATGGDAQRTRFKKSTESPPTLKEMGLDKKLSASSQKTASIPEKEFETKVALGREKIQDAIKSAHVSNNSGENEWYTPPQYIEAAREVMGSIDLDPASSAKANKTVQAKRFYTKRDSGLTKKWKGNVWMNPPYAQPLITEFSEKLISELKNINQAIVLVNNATDTEWLQDMMQYANMFCFVEKRIKFLDVTGNPTGSPLQGQVILYFGQNSEDFSNVFCEYGLILVKADVY